MRKQTSIPPAVFLSRELCMVLGRTIEHERREQRLTQARLAQLCGISRRHVAAIESGANFTVTILFGIMRVLPGVLLPVGALLLLNAWPPVTRR